jgi:hypothetical protein
MLLAVWTGPVVLSLIISTCALMGAAISIGWQIYTWRHNGPRVTVKAAHAFTVGPIGDQDLIAITAANDGRASTIVHQFGFKLPDDQIFVQWTSELPVELPAELKAGGEVSYYFSREGLQQFIAENSLEPKDFQPFVRSGHGEVVGSSLKWI